MKPEAPDALYRRAGAAAQRWARPRAARDRGVKQANCGRRHLELGPRWPPGDAVCQAGCDDLGIDAYWRRNAYRHALTATSGGDGFETLPLQPSNAASPRGRYLVQIAIVTFRGTRVLVSRGNSCGWAGRDLQRKLDAGQSRDPSGWRRSRTPRRRPPLCLRGSWSAPVGGAPAAAQGRRRRAWSGAAGEDDGHARPEQPTRPTCASADIECRPARRQPSGTRKRLAYRDRREHAFGLLAALSKGHENGAATWCGAILQAAASRVDLIFSVTV